MAFTYILDNAPEPVPLNPMHRDMIVAPLLKKRNNPRPPRFPMSCYAASEKLDKRALQGLYLAQHEAFLMIKVPYRQELLALSTLIFTPSF